MFQNDNIKGKVAVITGGGGVLCGNMARELGKLGVKVAILDLKLEAAELVAKDVNDSGGTAVGIECNVLKAESVKNAEAKVREIFGGYDILINGAGGNHPDGTTTKELLEKSDLDSDDLKTFYDMTPEGFGFVFNLNFLGTFIPTQVFSKEMARCGKGNIVNVSSMSGFAPLTKIPAYSAAKASINNFTQWTAVHMAEAGIRVNAIAPGFFLTAQNKTLLKNEDGSLTARSEKIINHTPMRRFGVPNDLMGTMIWLLDDEMSGFVTGITVPIDGGFMAYSGV